MSSPTLAGARGASMAKSTSTVPPAVLDIYGAAAYLGRTVKAMRRLRERRVGPPSFLNFGRVSYRVEELDRHLAANEAADSRTAPARYPTKRASASRPARSKAPSGVGIQNDDATGGPAPVASVESVPTVTPVMK